MINRVLEGRPAEQLPMRLHNFISLVMESFSKEFEIQRGIFLKKAGRAVRYRDTYESTGNKYKPLSSEEKLWTSDAQVSKLMDWLIVMDYIRDRVVLCQLSYQRQWFANNFINPNKVKQRTPRNRPPMSGPLHSVGGSVYRNPPAHRGSDHHLNGWGKYRPKSK